MTIIVGNHFNTTNKMQLNPTGLRIKCMVRRLIIISLSVKEMKESPCITDEEVTVAIQYFPPNSNSKG